MRLSNETVTYVGLKSERCRMLLGLNMGKKLILNGTKEWSGIQQGKILDGTDTGLKWAWKDLKEICDRADKDLGNNWIGSLLELAMRCNRREMGSA